MGRAHALTVAPMLSPKKITEFVEDWWGIKQPGKKPLLYVSQVYKLFDIFIVPEIFKKNLYISSKSHENSGVYFIHGRYR